MNGPENATPGAGPLRRAACPSCGEPWLRPTQLPGRLRCVNCLSRFELVSQCPDCGEHQTIVRRLDAPSRLSGSGRARRRPQSLTCRARFAPCVLAGHVRIPSVGSRR
jgi:hypothetical protein